MFILNFGETKEVPCLVAGVDLTDDKPLDPSGSTVTSGFALAAGGGRTAPTQWYSASWMVNVARQLYWVSTLLGPNGVFNIPKGTYVPWVQFAFGGETIQQPCLNDTLVVQ